MKIDLEKLSKLERRLNIEVPIEKVGEAFEKIYKKLQKQASIKGFRKGKAPINVIKNMYKDQAKGDVVQELVVKYYSEALDLHKLDPINHPQFNFDQAAEDQPFAFTAQFEIRPEIEIKSYDGLKVQKEKFEYTDEKIQSIIENLRSSYADLVPVLEDRTAQVGDVAIIDFEGECEGQKPEGMQAQGHMLEIGSKSTIDGFEDAIIGLKPGGTTEAKLDFPKDYHAAEIAGKPVTFHITLKELKKRSLPEVNDEFAKKIGFDSVEKMKENFKNDYVQSEEKRIKEDLKNRLLRALVEANPIEVPQSLLDSQKQLIVDDVKNRMKQQQGLDEAAFKDYVEKWNDDFESTASYIVQSSFLISKISDLENISPSPEDFNAKLEEYATQSGIEFEKVKAYYSDSDRAANLKFKMTEDKVIELLLSKAKIEEVEKEKLKDKDNKTNML